MNLLIVGGVAGGASAAARVAFLKRPTSYCLSVARMFRSPTMGCRTTLVEKSPNARRCSSRHRIGCGRDSTWVCEFRRLPKPSTAWP